ncbi:cation-translocating P-type ATPase [Campylobacter jejuni]|nr:cation-translocating P-type ATPase [Campylobacter jejuni]
MQEIRLKIGKMTCVNCSNAIEKVCKKLDGVEDASVSYINSSGVFLLKDAKTKQKVLDKITALGFEILADDENLAQYKLHSLKKLKWNFFVSLILSCVIMAFEMFVFNIFSSLIQLFLGAFVIFFCGREFFIHAIKGLKNRALDMNTLVSLGSFSAFVYSLLAFLGFFEEKHLYFSGGAMIISFILLGKFLEEKAKFKAYDYQRKLEAIDTQKALLVKDGVVKEILSSFVKENDEILVKEGESVCVDGVVISGKAEVDLSFLNGEFIPLTKQSGDLIQAGTFLINGNLRIKAQKKSIDSTLEKLKDLIYKAGNAKMPIAQFADKISAYFVAFILILSCFVFAFWAFKEGLNSAFLHACAVLLISCPCALGLATPIAIVIALSNAAKNGILIKNPPVLEILHKIQFSIFDKTGTLSEDKLKIYASLMSLQDFEKLTQIQKLSNHPISKAFSDKIQGSNLKGTLKTLPTKGIAYEEENVLYLAGNEKLLQEYQVSIDEKFLNFVQKNRDKAPVAVFFAKDKMCLGVVCLSNELRNDARNLCEFFTQEKITNVILSGDNENNVKTVASKLGIKEFYFALKPEEKLQMIKQYESKGKCLFMGDGINDAAALALADVGIVVNNANNLAKESGDIVLNKNELMLAAYVFKLSKKTMSIIKLNLLWAFVYNALCIPIAAGAFSFIVLSPHIAALAMCFSSLSVVLNSLRLLRKIA